MVSDAEVWEEHLVLYREADVLYREGKIKLALKYFRRALNLAPADVDTLWALGNCYGELRKPRKAELFFRRARAYARLDQRGDLLYNIGNALFDQGCLRAALQLYARVPRSANSFLLAQRNYRAAIRKLTKISSAA